MVVSTYYLLWYYRPISVLSSLCTIFEKYIENLEQGTKIEKELTDYLTENKI